MQTCSVISVLVSRVKGCPHQEREPEKHSAECKPPPSPISPLLYSQIQATKITSDFSHQDSCEIPWEIFNMSKNTLHHNVGQRKKFLDLFLYLTPHQNIMEPILGWDLSSIRGWCLCRDKNLKLYQQVFSKHV